MNDFPENQLTKNSMTHKGGGTPNTGDGMAFRLNLITG